MVLISGMSLPMIVRPQEAGGSRLVAPAYLHRTMNGEKWLENEDEELTCFIFKRTSESPTFSLYSALVYRVRDKLSFEIELDSCKITHI